MMTSKISMNWKNALETLSVAGFILVSDSLFGIYGHYHYKN